MPFLTVALAAMFAVSSPAAQAPSADQVEQAEQAEQADREFQAAYLRQFPMTERALRGSASPRDWALAAQLFKPVAWPEAAAPDKTRGALLRRAAQAAPTDRFVQWAWANTWPAASGCDEQHPCPERTAALAMLEPENGAAWLPVIDEALKAKDSARTDAALSKMATASRYDDLFVEAVRAWNDVYRGYPLPIAGNGDRFKVHAISAIAIAAVVGLPSYQALSACTREKNIGAPASRFEDCARIGRLMLNEGTSISARRGGQAFLRTSGTVTAEDLAAGRTLDWLSEKSSEQFRDIESDPSRFLAYVADLESTGSEINAAELHLHRAGIALVPPAEWQSRYGKLEASAQAR